MLVALAFAGVLLCSVPSVAGEPTAADRETARDLMKQARAARDRGDAKSALRSFEAADALMHVPTTAVEVVRTRIALGMLLEARDLALQTARSAAHPGEPAPFAVARTDAQKLSDDLEGRIPSIRITVAGGGAPDVVIDGAPLPAALVGLPRKVNPGKHAVRVQVGEIRRDLIVEISEREARDVPVDVSTPPPEAPTAGLLVADGADAKPRVVPLALTIGGFALAGAGAVIGSITGLMSISQTDTLKAECGGARCPASRQGEIDGANALATISTISFVAAGAGVAVGVTGLVMLLKKSPAVERLGAHVRPWIGAGMAGIGGTF